MMTTYKSQAGASTLLMVLIVALVLIVLSTSIQMFALLSTRRSAQTVNVQTVQFAAEGALFASVSQLKDNTTSLSLNTPETYTLGDTTITRTITGSATDEEADLIIQIRAEKNGVVRQLEGVFQATTTTTTNPDGTTPVPPDNPYVTHDQIDFYDRNDESGGFIIGPGESMVVKPSKGGWHFELLDNTESSTPMYIDQGYYKGIRRWLCHGLCPEFENVHNELSTTANVHVGDVIIAGEVAILDNDLIKPDGSTDDRELEIRLNDHIVKTCDVSGNLIDEPCAHQLTIEDFNNAGIDPADSADVKIIYEDSLGIFITGGTTEIIVPGDEFKTREYNFYYYEVEPN